MKTFQNRYLFELSFPPNKLSFLFNVWQSVLCWKVVAKKKNIITLLILFQFFMERQFGNFLRRKKERERERERGRIGMDTTRERESVCVRV